MLSILKHKARYGKHENRVGCELGSWDLCTALSLFMVVHAYIQAKTWHGGGNSVSPSVLPEVSRHSLSQGTPGHGASGQPPCFSNLLEAFVCRSPAIVGYGVCNSIAGAISFGVGRATDFRVFTSPRTMPMPFLRSRCYSHPMTDLLNKNLCYKEYRAK